ncbi:uncharacterized protein LOC103313535 [Tribolium castaneum]|uniref:Gustatory receptor n=1 Tax=Tribolium castaneum TaxID=7070 RepID=D6WQW8_TRICA|nr:PREDICTED: uncharacterized protein LOC103313535 [Tribolium castaneum]EFA07602.1 gustatory receptor 60 [Tribolium castaneum]|eukprot:XP_008195241.1 PREDICTED: uncharacterized protein LOC103313535 [Tribolium castaneum]
MSLKSVNLVLKIGSLLALTPAKIKKNRVLFPSKAYAFFWIILFLTGVSVSAFYRKALYEEYSTIRIILQVATDIILLILNISTIVITRIKKHQWNKFIRILQTLKSNKESFSFLPFFITNVVLMIMLTYETYLWSSIMGVEYYEMYAVEYFQTYAQFIVYYLIYAFLNLILDRAENLSKKVSFLKLNRLNFNLKKIIKSDFCALAECLDTFNDIFGWLILLLIGFCLLQQLTYLHNLIIQPEIQEVKIIIYEIIYITWHMVGTFSSVFICDLIQQKVRNIETAASSSDENEFKESKKLRNVIVNDHFPHFTAAQFFDLNRKTILGVFNALVTFVIVAIQFDSVGV